jgi:uncharacterized OB-fold protein
MSHNVVASWRARAALLGRAGWRCAACGRLALAHRRVCTGCGAVGRAEPAPLPRRGTVAALSVAGAAVEHLDQVTARKPAVLVELEGGARVACLLAHADSITLAAAVRGQPVRLAVRRIPLAVAASEPIPYGLKAALDLETRAALKARDAEKTKKE